ncbi:hypothetical protein F4782DRAFT_522470 [Xylaria castorea]|nr:hypothetical protein F4782DRAFT_522470 [Xylaria castorea]
MGDCVLGGVAGGVVGLAAGPARRGHRREHDEEVHSLQSRFTKTSGVTEAELLALLDYYCDPARLADPGYCESMVMRFALGVVNSKLAYVMRKPMFRGIEAALVSSDASPGAKGAAAVFQHSSGRTTL